MNWHSLQANRKTTTWTGLKVRAKLDTTANPAGRKVSEKEVVEIDFRRDSLSRSREGVQTWTRIS